MRRKLYIRWESSDGLSMDSQYILPESTCNYLIGKRGQVLSDALGLISLGFDFVGFDFVPAVPKSFIVRITHSMKNGWHAVSCARNLWQLELMEGGKERKSKKNEL